MRTEHKRVPITPRELGRDAGEVVKGGAAAVHIHPRLPNGIQTLEAKPCGDAIMAVRNACRAPVGVSTASWIEKRSSRKVSLINNWKVNPDFASVNFNEEGWRDVCKVLTQRGIWIEAGLWSARDARTFVSSGIEKGCLRALVEAHEKDPAQAVSNAEAMDELLRKGRIRIPVLHHGHDVATWNVVENALDLGRDIRVGLEDTLVLPNGNRAESNAQLVKIALSMARRRGLLPTRLEGLHD